MQGISGGLKMRARETCRDTPNLKVRIDQRVLIHSGSVGGNHQKGDISTTKGKNCIVILGSTPPPTNIAPDMESLEEENQASRYPPRGAMWKGGSGNLAQRPDIKNGRRVSGRVSELLGLPRWAPWRTPWRAWASWCSCVAASPRC